MLLSAFSLSSCKKEQPADQTPTKEQSDDPKASDDPTPSEDPSQDTPQRTDITDDYAYIDASLAELIKSVDPTDFKPLVNAINKYIKANPEVDGNGINMEAALEEQEDGTYLVNLSKLTGTYTMVKKEGSTKPTFEYKPGEGKIELIIPVFDAEDEPEMHILIMMEGETGWIKVEEYKGSDVRLPVPAKLTLKASVGDDVLVDGTVELSLSDGLGDEEAMFEAGEGHISVKGQVRVLDYTIQLNGIQADIDFDSYAGTVKGNIGLSKNGSAILGIDADLKGSMLMTGESFNISGDLILVTTDKLCLNLNAKNLVVGEELFGILDKEFETEAAAVAEVEKIMDAVDFDIYYGNRVYGHDKRNAELFLYPISESGLAELFPEMSGKSKAGEDGSGDPEPEPEIEHWYIAPMYAFQSENFENAWLIYPSSEYIVKLVNKFPETQSALIGFQNKLSKLGL